jgi:hypothetical protein
VKNEGRVCGYPPLAHPRCFEVIHAARPVVADGARAKPALLMVGVAQSTPYSPRDLRTYASTGSAFPFTRNSGSRSTTAPGGSRLTVSPPRTT